MLDNSIAASGKRTADELAKLNKNIEDQNQLLKLLIEAIAKKNE